jgi:hypothetical protein
MPELKLKRLAGGISGGVLCAKAGISRSRLSLIERGFVCPGPDEASRINDAVDQLIEAKAVIDRGVPRFPAISILLPPKRFRKRSYSCTSVSGICKKLVNFWSRPDWSLRPKASENQFSTSPMRLRSSEER